MIHAAKSRRSNESIFAGQTVDVELLGFSLFSLIAAGRLHSSSLSFSQMTQQLKSILKQPNIPLCSLLFFHKSNILISLLGASTSHVYLNNFQRSP